MSEERLSRLQKWILKALYAVGPEYRIPVRSLIDASIYRMGGDWAKVNDLPSPWGKQRPHRASITVSISRAIYSLIYKKLLWEFGCESNPCVDFYQVNSIRRRPVKSVLLTEEGEAKAQELLNVKKSEVNNKELWDKCPEVNMEEP
jgi:hypothetical protein